VIIRSLGNGITSWHAATRLTVANNTSVFNGGNGILIGSGDSGATSGNTGGYILNNITYGNAGAGIVEHDDGKHPVGPNSYMTNLMFANRENEIAPRRGGNVSGSIMADPLFVDASKDDYHVQPTSPAVDAGTGMGPISDLDGTAQPQGRSYDIGAYER